MDSCIRDLVALGRSLSLVPDFNVDNGTCSDNGAPFNVAGIVGPMYSSASIMVSPLMSLYQIPVLATFSTLDDLSNKAKYEYFMRMVPPTRFQVNAIFDFMQYYNFSYVSILYNDNTYGETNARYFHQEAKKRGMCIGVSERLTYDRQSYDSIARKLIKNKEARVVVIFPGGGTKLFYLFDMIKEKDISRYFIWLSVYVWTSDKEIENGYEDIANGFIYIRHSGRTPYDKFVEYYKYLTPLNVTGNPWFKPLWENYYGCQWGNPENDCADYAEQPNSDYPVTSNAINQYYDAVYVFAYALNMLINANCPAAFNDVSLLNECVKGELLLSFMKKVSFEGKVGQIKFNSDGDLLADYTFFQYMNNDNAHARNIIGTWDKSTEYLELYEERIHWDMLNKDIDVIEAVEGIPESICSYPCGPKQFPVQQEVHDFRFC